MKIVIYSVNTGGYDEFRTPNVFDPNVRYILFTDNKYFRSKVWEICHVDFLSHIKDKRRIARYIKTNPHKVLPNHDVNIWVDHCYKPRFNNSTEMLKIFGFEDKQIMNFKHDVRNCIYDESKVVINDKLDYENVVNEQMEFYRNEGFPKNMGLFDTGFTIRKNNELVNKFNNTWWNMIEKFSARDQLSQVYSSWKNSVTISGILNQGSIYDNKFLNKKIKHPKKWSI
jgi:hypothetical protein